jgi:hypothetical protein
LHDGPHEARDAVGRALVAAATGMNPNDPDARYVEHGDGHRAVLDRSLAILAETGDDFPSEFRDDMAKVLSNHGDSVHHTMSAHATDEDDPTWSAKFIESGVGAAVSYTPVAGPVVDKGVGIVVEAWKQDEEDRIDQENQRMKEGAFTAREGQLQSLANEWIAADPGSLDGATPYTITDEINGAAFDGNHRAQGLAGK